jgi:hypothetical protein
MHEQLKATSLQRKGFRSLALSVFNASVLLFRTSSLLLRTSALLLRTSALQDIIISKLICFNASTLQPSLQNYTSLTLYFFNS